MKAKKNDFWNKTAPVVLILIVVALGLYHLIMEHQPVKPLEVNWEQCLRMGMCQVDGQPRQPTEFDYDTGVKMNYQNMTFEIFHSRTLAAGDIGKLFPVRIA